MIAPIAPVVKALETKNAFQIVEAILNMKITLARLLLSSAVLLSHLLTGYCHGAELTSRPKCPEDSRSILELAPPRNGLEILQNIKKTLDLAILNRYVFLDDEALKRITGAKQISRGSVPPNLAIADAVDLESVDSNIQIGPDKMSGLVIRVQRFNEQGGRSRTVLIMIFTDSQPTLRYPVVTAMLGGSFIQSKRVPGTHEYYGRPIDENSNSEVTKKRYLCRSTQTIVLNFGDDSTLTRATFTESDYEYK